MMPQLIPAFSIGDGLPDAHSQIKFKAHEGGALERTSEIEVKIDFHVSNIDGSIDWQTTAQRLAERLITERMQNFECIDAIRKITTIMEHSQDRAMDQARYISRTEANREAGQATNIEESRKAIQKLNPPHAR